MYEVFPRRKCSFDFRWFIE